MRQRKSTGEGQSLSGRPRTGHGARGTTKPSLLTFRSFPGSGAGHAPSYLASVEDGRRRDGRWLTLPAFTTSEFQTLPPPFSLVRELPLVHSLRQPKVHDLLGHGIVGGNVTVHAFKNQSGDFSAKFREISREVRERRLACSTRHHSYSFSK